MQEHDSYKIFLFPRGWFYDKRTQQKLEFIDVRRGENVKIQLSLQVLKATNLLFKTSLQQMQKLHIDEFYRKTVSPDTADCEPDPGFNYDKACTFLCSIQWKVRFLWTRSTSGSTSKRIASCPATEGFTWTTSPSAQPPASMRWLSSFYQSWKMTTQL